MMLEEMGLINGTEENLNRKTLQALAEESLYFGNRFVIESGRITKQENIPADYQSEQG